MFSLYCKTEGYSRKTFSFMLQKIKTKRKQKTEQKEIKGPVKTLFIGSNPYLLTVLLSIQFHKSPSFFPIKLFTSIQWVHWYAIPFTEAKHPLGGPKRIFYYPSGPLSLPAIPNRTKFLFPLFLGYASNSLFLGNFQDLTFWTSRVVSVRLWNFKDGGS